jgi:hypothetical protein
LHLNTRKNATSYSKINAMNINQGELLSRFSVKVGWDDRATLANRAILYENARAQKTGTLCQRQSKSEPKGSAKCCHFGVSEIAA